MTTPVTPGHPVTVEGAQGGAEGPAHWLPKPLALGDQKVALCGAVVTVSKLALEPGRPVCQDCQNRYSRLPSTKYVWFTTDGNPPMFDLAISA